MLLTDQQIKNYQNDGVLIIKDIFKKVYGIEAEADDDSKRNFKIFKDLFSDSDGKFKISSISKLF